MGTEAVKSGAYPRFLHRFVVPAAAAEYLDRYTKGEIPQYNTASSETKDGEKNTASAVTGWELSVPVPERLLVSSPRRHAGVGYGEEILIECKLLSGPNFHLKCATTGRMKSKLDDKWTSGADKNKNNSSNSNDYELNAEATIFSAVYAWSFLFEGSNWDPTATRKYALTSEEHQRLVNASGPFDPISFDSTQGPTQILHSKKFVIPHPFDVLRMYAVVKDYHTAVIHIPRMDNCWTNGMKYTDQFAWMPLGPDGLPVRC